MRKYQAFLKVVECGSFTVAADELNYTQSAVSQMISSLEKELNTTLFIRSKYGLRLTYEGVQLLPFVRDLVSSYKHLNEKTEALNGLQTGIIKLGTFGTFAGSVLPDILKSFHNDYPNIIFDFYQNFYRDIEHWVSKDVIDFGITRIDEIKGFQVTRLFEDPLFVALPEGHRLSGETTLTVDMIKDEPFLVLDERDDKNFINILRSMNIELDIKFHMCDYNSLQAMVEKGMGIAIMPKLAILAGRFNIVNIPFEPKISRTIGVIYKNKNQLPAPSRIFIDYLVEHTKDFLADE